MHSQEQLDAIAYKLNIRPRQRFEYRCPIEVISEVMAKEYNAATLVQYRVALRVCNRQGKSKTATSATQWYTVINVIA